MTKTRGISVIVSGTGYFPVDMLRYDCCFPASEKDVVAISKSMKTPNRQEVVAIHLFSAYGKVTPERWASFGWQVKSTMPLL